MQKFLDDEKVVTSPQNMHENNNNSEQMKINSHNRTKTAPPKPPRLKPVQLDELACKATPNTSVTTKSNMQATCTNREVSSTNTIVRQPAKHKKHLHFKSSLETLLGESSKGHAVVIDRPHNATKYATILLSERNAAAAAETSFTGRNEDENSNFIGTEHQSQSKSSQENASKNDAIDGTGKHQLAVGCTSLMHACQNGDIFAVLEQMRLKPERLRQRDSRNKNALHYCAAQSAQKRDLVAAASIAIAAPELLESADEDGFTPLHLAVIQGNLAMVNLLLANKADVNAVDNEGHSVVHWATVCGEVEALRSVLLAGANAAIPDINGGSPLHYAAQMCGANYDGKLGQGNSTKLALEILNVLLAHPQTSVDVQDNDGRQPLLWAASAGSAKAVIALVKAGARVESADKDGLTALHCAASRGHTECIDTLISLCGAPTDLIDSNGCTALHYAVTLGHADATSRLLHLEADPNRQDRKGRTPAHCGCSKGQFETVKLLKEGNANLWLRNAKGDLPIHEAASSGRRELVAWLLDQRPNQVNTTSNDGRSLLHIAASNDYTDMCKMLLDAGGDINAIYRNSKGITTTPLDCALQKGNRSTAKFLQSNGGLPASKLRLAARRANPFQEATAEIVRPLKYAEKEEVHDLQNSKKYVVYLRRSDSDGGGIADDGNCSCTERTYKREHRIAHKCRRHRQQALRRRTNSCGEAKETGLADDGSGDICRSKSNIEIRCRKSKTCNASTTDWDSDENDEDSCENCCYHKRQKRRVIQRRRTTSTKRSRESLDSDGELKKSRTTKDSLPDKQKESIEDAKLVEDSIVTKETVIEVQQEKSATPTTSRPNSKKSTHSRPQSSTKQLTPPSSAVKEGTFIKSPPATAKSEEDKSEDKISTHALELTDEEISKAAETVVTQVDVHHGADETKQDETAIISSGDKAEDDLEKSLAKRASIEIEQVLQMAATAVASEFTNSTEVDIKETVEIEKVPAPKDESVGKKPEFSSDQLTTSNEKKQSSEIITKPEEAATPSPQPESNLPPLNPDDGASKEKQSAISETENQGEIVSTDQKESAVEEKSNKTPPKPTEKSEEDAKKVREQESRRSFTLLPSDSAEEEAEPEHERKSSFQVLNSDESGADLDLLYPHATNGDKSDSQIFKIMQSHSSADGELQTADYEDDYEEADIEEDKVTVGSPLRHFKERQNRHGVGNVEAATGSVPLVYDGTNGRKRRLKRRVKSGGSRTRSNWKGARDAREGQVFQQQSTKDQDSGFEPSPRGSKTRIPAPRNVFTAYTPRRTIYTTLDGRSCSSRMENRKPGDKSACDMTAVTRSIQRNIRRYYMERKIFQHLLELKSLQIRSNKLNEAVLVKRAVDDYHKSCSSLGGETGTRLRRYNFSEYSFKNFELFLYETLKALQKPGTYNFQNINEVYEEAERRLSPDYNAYEKALHCTTKTHRCPHAIHAYTGIPCAAYIPMMNHHTMPKFGFGSYKKTGVGSFYLPKILTKSNSCGGADGAGGGGGGVGANSCSGKMALELTHGKSKQLISLPSDKLDSNKRYFVTFTIKETGGGNGGGGGGGGGSGTGLFGAATSTDKQQNDGKNTTGK